MSQKFDSIIESFRLLLQHFLFAGIKVSTVQSIDTKTSLGWYTFERPIVMNVHIRRLQKARQ